MEYVERQQVKITEYVSGRTIYTICTGAGRMEVSSRFLRWWHQYHFPKQVEREVERKNIVSSVK